MNKSIKTLLLLAALLVLLVGISSASAAGMDNQTSTAQDTPVASDSTGNAVSASSDNSAADTASANNKVSTNKATKNEAAAKKEVASDKTEDNANYITKNTTKSLKKANMHIVTNETFSNYFTNAKLNSNVSEGDTLDFRGLFNSSSTNNYTMTIDKPINMVSTTHDAKIVLNSLSQNLLGTNSGDSFTISHDGSYTNVTGISFFNTQIFVKNATHVTLDNISVVVVNRTIGGGVGVTSIRENSTYCTVKNSFFSTTNNGGSSTLVFAWADNSVIFNNTIEGHGNCGNLLYLNLFNIYVDIPQELQGKLNSNNTIANNTVGTPGSEMTGIMYGITLTGLNNVIENNTIYGTGAGITIAFNSVGQSNYTYRNNCLPDATLYAVAESRVYNNTVGELYLTNNCQAHNNTVYDGLTALGSGNNITYNTITSNDTYAVTLGNNNNLTDNYITTPFNAGDVVISGVTTSLVANNTPVVKNQNVTITDDTYPNYFDANGYINNSIIGNYTTIILAGEFNNRNFNFKDIILTVKANNTSTVLKSSKITSSGDGRIYLYGIKINNTESNIENTIVLESSGNVMEKCVIYDSSQRTDINHRTICITGDGNKLANNTITTYGHAGSIDFSTDPSIATTASIVITSSNNNITKNIINAYQTTATSDYGTIEAITIQQGSSGLLTAQDNIIQNNKIQVNATAYAYGINMGTNVNNNTIIKNTIECKSKTYSAGIQLYSPATGNNISNNNLNVTAGLQQSNAAYGVLVNNNTYSYGGNDMIGYNTIGSNNINVTACQNYGIEIYGTNYNNITKNNIKSNGNYSTGMAIIGQYNNIQNNNLAVTGTTNTTIDSFDEIKPTTTGINILKESNNNITANNINVTHGVGITLNGSKSNIIENNNINTTNGNGIASTSETNDLINKNNIKTALNTVILLDKTTQTNITNNNLTTSLTAGVLLTESMDNVIKNNAIMGNGSYGNQAVINHENNTVTNNTPEIGDGIIITDSSYSNYFDENGNIIAGKITEGSVIVIAGNLYNKNMVINMPVNITTYNSPTIYEGSIIFAKGSDGSNTSFMGSGTSDCIAFKNSNITINPGIIIENTSNIKVSIRGYEIKSNYRRACNVTITVINSNNITLHDSYLYISQKNTTGIKIINSTDVNVLNITVTYSLNDYLEGISIDSSSNVFINDSDFDSYDYGKPIKIINGSHDITINETKLSSILYGTNATILFINATEDNPIYNIHFNGNITVRYSSNNPYRGCYGIWLNNTCNSTFSGLITTGKYYEHTLINMINSDNNLINCSINVHTSKTSNEYKANIATLTNSNNNTITNINLTTNQLNKGITLINSTNNKIANNSLTLQALDYTITLNNSNNNTIENNYLATSLLYGDSTIKVINSTSNTIQNNTPTTIKLTDDNYKDYFDENGYLKSRLYIIEISSDLYNKDLKFNKPVILLNTQYTIYNGTILLDTNAANSNASFLSINNANKPAFIIESANNQILKNTIAIQSNSYDGLIVINNTNNTFNYNNITITGDNSNIITILSDNNTLSYNNITLKGNKNNITSITDASLIKIQNNNIKANGTENIAIQADNTVKTSITKNNITMPTQTITEPIQISNSANTNITSNNISTSDLAGGLGISIANSSNITLKNNVPKLIITNDNYGEYFAGGIFKYNTVDSIEFGSDFYNKNMTFAKQIAITNPNKYVIYNGTITFNNAETASVEDIYISNTDNRQSSLIVNDTSIEISGGAINQTNTNINAIAILVENATSGGIYLEDMDIVLMASNSTLLKANNIPTNKGITISDNNIITYGNNTAVCNITNVYGVQFGSNKIKANTDTPTTIIAMDNMSIAYVSQNYVGLKANNGNTPIVNITNCAIYGYVVYNFIESYDLAGDSAIYGDSSVTKEENYPMGEMGHVAYITGDIPEYMTVNQTYEIHLYATDMLDRPVNDKTLYVKMGSFGEYYLTLKNGTASFEFMPTKYTYLSLQAEIYDYETMEYVSDTYSKRIPILLIKTNITVNSITNKTMGEKATIRGTLTDQYNNTLGNLNVTIKVNNETFNATTDNNGAYAIEYTTTTAGQNNVTVNYQGARYYENGYYNSSQTNTTFTAKHTTTITLEPIAAKYNQTTTLIATATDELGNNVTEGTIKYYINNDLIAIAAIANGSAAVKCSLEYKPGTYTITAIYEQTELYTQSTANTVLTINKLDTNIILDNVTAAYGEKFTLKATLKDENGNIINGGKVAFKLNGKTIKDANGNAIYVQVVNGLAQITLDGTYSAKNYIISVVYSGNNVYSSQRANSTLTITKANPTAMTVTPDTYTPAQGETITVTVEVNGGSTKINTGKAILKLNGVSLRDSNGNVIYGYVKNGKAQITVKIPANMKSKTYNLTAVYNANNYNRCEASTNVTIIAKP